MQDVHEPIRATPQRGQRAEGQRAAAILAAEGRSSAIDQVFQTVHRNDPVPKVGAPFDHRPAHPPGYTALCTIPHRSATARN